MGLMDACYKVKCVYDERIINLVKIFGKNVYE